MKRAARNPSSRLRVGFTMVELAIAITLLAVVLGSVALVAGTGERVYTTGAVLSHLEGQAGVTVHRLVGELRTAGRDTLNPDPGSAGTDTLEYLQALSLESGVVTWSSGRRLAFEYEPLEIDDGIDNNDNGLVDEGRLVLTTGVGTAQEHSIVLTRWVAELLEGELANGLDDNGNGLVDEPGFVVVRAGESLVVRFTLQRRDVQGRPMTVTALTSVRPRNRVEPEEEEE